MEERKGGDDLRGVEGEETLIRMYCVREYSNFQKKGYS